MVTIHFNKAHKKPMAVEPIQADGLFNEIKNFYEEHLARKPRQSSTAGGLGFQRVSFFVRSDKKGGVSLTLIKPDECRYWIRSLAMRDADQMTSLLLGATASKR
jgi:hypothetical protein